MDRAPTYYAGSITIPVSLRLLLLALALGAGCGGPNQAARGARRLSYADLTGAERQAALSRLTQLPAVIHFRKGDRIPVDLQLDSSLLELQTAPLLLVAKRDFYMLLHEDGGPLLSEDGRDFESPSARKNYFFFGFDVQRDRATLLRVRFGVRPDAAAQSR